MGRAIDQDNRLDGHDSILENQGNTINSHDHRIKLLEDALEEMIQTRVHHVDLTDTNNVRVEGVEVEPSEKFTPPVGKRKVTKKKTATVE